MNSGQNFPEVRRAVTESLANGDLEEALEGLHRHLGTHPQDRASHLQAFALCERLYRFDAAVAHARQAWTLLPGDLEPMRGAAMLLFLNARYDASLAILREITPEDNTDVEALVLLADVAQRAGQPEAAGHYAAGALRRVPGHPRAVRILAHLERRAGNLEAARRRLEDRLGHDWQHPDRWRVMMELAAVLDAEGAVAAAFPMMSAAKQHLLHQQPPCGNQARQVRQRQEEIVRHLTPADYTRWQEQSAALAPCRLTVLAGHTRSGTTLLEQRLTAFPDAIGTDESGVFNREFAAPLFYHRPGSPSDALTEWESWDADALDAGRSTFLNLTEAVIGQPIGDRLLIEKDPLRTPDLPLFLRLFPESSILMPLRHPCDIALSVWMTLLPIGREGWAASSPAAALESVAHTLRCWSILKERLPQAWREVRYETFTAQPAEQTAALAHFLQLRQEVAAPPAGASGRGISTPSWTHAAGPVHSKSVNRWHRYAEYLAPLAKPHAVLFREFGYEV